MLSTTKPSGFKATEELLMAFVECGSGILLMKGENVWELPAGRREEGESLRDAMTRILAETTGVDRKAASAIPIKTAYLQMEGRDILLHIFRVRLFDEIAERVPSNSSSPFRWVRPSEAVNMDDLLRDVGDMIRLCYAI